VFKEFMGTGKRGWRVAIYIECVLSFLEAMVNKEHAEPIF
jgi:hypothetical protein